MSLMEILIVVALAVWTLVGLGVLAAFVYGAPLLRRLDRTLATLERIADVVDRHVEPLLYRTARVAEEAEQMTASLRSDVEALGEAVQRGTRSADRILDTIEDRVAELDGLLETAQHEAEESFVAVASVLRTVRAVSDRLGDEKKRKWRLFG